MIARHLILCLISFLISILANSQQFDWCRYDSTLFKEDSVKSFLKKGTSFGSIDLIKNGNAEIELRYYPGACYACSNNFFYQVKIKGQNIERWVYSANWLYGPRPQNRELIDSNAFTYLYKRQVTPVVPKEDSLFKLIYTNTLTTILDQQLLIDSLKKTITIYDWYNNPFGRCFDCPSGFDLLQVKIGNKYRSFGISQQAAAYSRFNPGIIVLEDYAKLRYTLLNYFRDYYLADTQVPKQIISNQ